MRTSTRIPNQALRRLLAESAWSGAQLARAVNEAAAESGMDLHYDRTTVGHWLAGSRPRPPVAELAAEVLSRHLGRTVTPEETDLTAVEDSGGEPSSAYRGGAAVDRLEALGMGERADRRSVTLLGTYSLAALALPGWSTPVAAGRRPADPPPGQPRSHPAAALPPGAGGIESARLLLSLFSEHDAAFGGVRIRGPLSRYLATTITPWLRQDLPPRVRRDLLTVSGQLAYLCAFAHFDANLQPRAQHYYLTALGLAREAGDRTGYAVALRGLSVQAYALGHPRPADRLAAQAVEVGLRHAPAHQQAFLLAQRAVTQAALGEARSATLHLAAAAALLENARDGNTPVGAYHPGSLALQRAAVAGALGDHRGAADALASSLRQRPEGERRSRLISLADLAEAQLRQGSLDLACHTWSTFLDHCPGVDSARVHDRLRSVRARLRPHAAYRPAALLAERATRLTRRPARGAPGV